MNKPKLIFHIGSPKTGTKSIQHSMRYNDGCLKEMGYFNYPGVYHSLLLTIIAKHEGFYRKRKEYFRTPAEISFEYYMRQYTNSGCENIVISCEGIFKRLHRDNAYSILNTIRNLFDGFDIKIVCYLRRQDLFFESLYNQTIKEICFSSYRKPFKKENACLDNYGFEQEDSISRFEHFIAETNQLGSYDESMSRLASVFGKENIIIRPFEESQLKKGLIHDFYSNALGFTDDEISGLKPIERINERMCRDILEFKLACRIDDRSLFELLDNITDYKCANQRFFTNNERKRFIALYEAGNAAVAREYLGRKDGKLFYDEILEYEPYPGLSPEKAKELRRKIMNVINCYNIEYDKGKANEETVDDIAATVRKMYFDNVSNEYLQAKLEGLFDKISEQGKNVVIYGALGSLAERVFEVAEPYKKCVDIFVSDKAIQNLRFYRGYAVASLSAIKALKPDIIIITAKFSGEAIKRDLAKLMLPNTIICPAYDFKDEVWEELFPSFTGF